MKSQKDKIREKKGKIEKDMQKRENFDNFEMNTDLDPKRSYRVSQSNLDTSRPTKPLEK